MLYSYLYAAAFSPCCSFPWEWKIGLGRGWLESSESHYLFRKHPDSLRNRGPRWAGIKSYRLLSWSTYSETGSVKIKCAGPSSRKKQNFPCVDCWNSVIHAASQRCAPVRLLGGGFLLRWPRKDDYLMVLFSSNVSAFNCGCRTTNRDLQKSTTWYCWSGDQDQFLYLL